MSYKDQPTACKGCRKLNAIAVFKACAGASLYFRQFRKLKYFMRIRFDESPVLFGSDFQTPTQIITVTTLAELAPASERLEAAQRSGHWLAGYASY